jgi:phosphate starvation-inducible membrane PsiE
MVNTLALRLRLKWQCVQTHFPYRFQIHLPTHTERLIIITHVPSVGIHFYRDGIIGFRPAKIFVKKVAEFKTCKLVNAGLVRL